MGAPKQKWNSDEEAALRAGVKKHGPGKWRTILKDPEFSAVLRLRSNVDLKDKWRNMNVLLHGLGSRERGKLALKRNKPVLAESDNQLAISTLPQALALEVVDVKPLNQSEPMALPPIPKKSIPRAENVIMDALTNLKDTTGSDKRDIATYIEDQYGSPPDFKKWLSQGLKTLVASQKLVKVKRRYKIVTSSGLPENKDSNASSEGRQRETVGAKQKDAVKVERGVIRVLTKSQIDAELAKLRNMTAQEAAAFAARAVAEAEAAIAEAEEAEREAAAAEADAETAHLFAQSAMAALKGKNLGNMIIQV